MIWLLHIKFTEDYQANNIKVDTALKEQEYSFNEKTEDLLIAGMTEDNLNKHYDRQEKQFNIAALRKTFDSMVDAQIWQNKFDSDYNFYNRVYMRSNGVNDYFDRINPKYPYGFSIGPLGVSFNSTY